MRRVAALVLSLALLTDSFLYAQSPRQLFKAETVMIENFRGESVYPDVNEPIQWMVRASKGSAPEYPRTTMANAWPEDKYGPSPENPENFKAYSVNASFTRRGFNTVEITPARTVEGEMQPVPIRLDGNVLGISAWVWGSNYYYDMEAIVVDREGIEHRLPMGKLNFMGWRNLTASVPRSIPQKGKNPFSRGLKLKGFLITTNPTESSENFYVYMTDVTISSIVKRYYNFDGSDLIDPKKVAEVWSSADSASAQAPADGDAPRQGGGAAPGQSPDDLARADQGESAKIPVVGSDNPAFQKLQEISISRFEDASAWTPSISRDFGYAAGRAIEGSPSGKQPITNEEAQPADGDKYVYGTKVIFIRRGLTPISIISARPIPVDGLVKVVSVWAAGRNIPHKLSLLVNDRMGRIKKLYMGKLDFMGWRQMSVAIPESVQQRGFGPDVGLQIVGLQVDTDLPGSRGNYYLYVDDMRAWVDFGAFNSQDEDDPVDAW